MGVALMSETIAKMARDAGKPGEIEYIEVKKVANGYICRVRYCEPKPKKGSKNQIGRWIEPEECVFNSMKDAAEFLQIVMGELGDDGGTEESEDEESDE